MPNYIVFLIVIGVLAHKKYAVIRVPKPRIPFGGTSWLTTRTINKVENIFNVLKNAATRLIILGAVRSSLTALMRHDTNMMRFLNLSLIYFQEALGTKQPRHETPNRKITQYFIKLS